jgi:hypothetical protein
MFAGDRKSKFEFEGIDETEVLGLAAGWRKRLAGPARAHPAGTRTATSPTVGRSPAIPDTASRSQRDVTTGPAAAGARPSRSEDERRDRKRGLLLTGLTLVVGLVGVLVALLVATPMWHDLFAGSSSAPGVLVVVDPDVGPGGTAIYAIPAVSQPVDYVAAGAQLRVACVRGIDKKYTLAYIVGAFETDRWVDATALDLPQGGKALPVLVRRKLCNN